MTGGPKLTKRHHEVTEMMRSGWDLHVQASQHHSRKPKAFLLKSEGMLVTGNREISWTIIEALEKAHLIKPIRRSSENSRVWIYSLVDTP
jgi:hypothetical protein